MHTRLPCFIAILVTDMALLCACSPPNTYSGDGRLIDYGPTAPDHRYVIEMGPIDLSRTGTYKFKMTGLPRTYFVMGLQIPLRAADRTTGNLTTPANISLDLERRPGDMVAMVTTPLRDWTWSNPKLEDKAFAYLRQSPRAFFDAFTEHHYELTVTVNVPDSSIPAGTLVELKSAGWK